MDHTIKVVSLTEEDLRKRIAEVEGRTGYDLWELREKYYKHGLDSLAGEASIAVIALFTWLEELEGADEDAPGWTIVRRSSGDVNWPERPDLALAL